MSTLKKKAAVMSRELAQRLTVRFAGTGLTVSEGVDASGNPTISINDGTPATTEQNIFMRLIELDSIGLNGIGSAQQSFGPHAVQIVMEATAAAATVALVTEANKLRVLGEVSRFGPRIELYVRANGGAPVVGDIVGGNLVYTFHDLYHALTNDM